MSQSQERCVKEIAAGHAIFLDEIAIAVLPIDVVTHGGVTDRTEVNANLMGTSRLNPDLQQRKSVERFQDVVRAERGSSPAGLGAHPRPDGGMTRDIQEDFTFRFGELSM